MERLHLLAITKFYGVTMSSEWLQCDGGQSHWWKEGQGAERPGYWKDSPHIYEITKNHDRNSVKE